MQEQANMVDQSRHPISAPYGNTYNPDWRNHPNLSWKPKPPAYTPTGSQQQQTPPSSPVEQAIVNLSKVVGHFVEEQKTVNAQTTQKIETLEGTVATPETCPTRLGGSEPKPWGRPVITQSLKIISLRKRFQNWASP